MPVEGLPPLEQALGLLTGPLVVLTGAGLSTESGIPDYRGPGSVNRLPMTYQDFIAAESAQKRYWARSMLGWRFMGAAQPNQGHHALVASAPDFLITQNVDGLHEQAGSDPVVALHGRVSEVICLDCDAITDRLAEQERLGVANPLFAEAARDVDRKHLRPDGDAALEDTDFLVLPGCTSCGGRLKPHVVFFGENVPRQRVERCYEAVDSLVGNGGALLVAGSSLAVMSGLRFVKRAAGQGTPVVIVNRGATRGDDLADIKVDQGCTEFLVSLADRRQ